MKPPIDFSPIVQRACKFLKIGNRNENGSGSGSPRRKSYKGISFSNDVYQQTCKPIVDTEENSRPSLALPWHRNSASDFTVEEHNRSRRSSVRAYDSPWGLKATRKSTKCKVYEEVDDLCEPPKMEEGIFTVEVKIV